MIPRIKEYLFKNWEKIGLGERPDDLLFIKFADRRIRDPEVGTITFLVKAVRGGGETPLAILRIPRYPQNKAARQTLENESAHLLQVHEKLSGSPLLAAVPRSILLTEVRSSLVFMLGFLPGKDMGARVISRDMLSSYVENFKLSFGWLIGFEKEWGSREVRFDEELVGRYVKPVLDTYRRTFPRIAAAHEKYFSKILARAAEQYGKTISLSPQHGDFHASNIFFFDGRITAVIDWEDFKPDGFPCHDLFHYIKTYLEAVFEFTHKHGNPEMVKTVAEGAGWGEAITNLARSYCQAMGIDPEVMEIFLPLFLIETQNVAGSARKRAAHIIKKNELLLGLEPFSLDDLRFYMSVFAYVGLHSRAAEENNAELAGICKERIGNIQKVSLKKKQSP